MSHVWRLATDDSQWDICSIALVAGRRWCMHDVWTLLKSNLQNKMLAENSNAEDIAFRQQEMQYVDFMLTFDLSDSERWELWGVGVIQRNNSSSLLISCSQRLDWYNQKSQTRWLYCVECYSARSAQLSVHEVFTSCIWRGLVSCDSIVDGDWLPATEWCWRYLPCCQPTSNFTENLGRFLVRVYRPGELLWVDSSGRNGN